jgi:xyloglucan-specific exo-beta-1,4-glucanase
MGESILFSVFFLLLSLSFSLAAFPKTLKWTNVVIGGGGFIPGLVFNPAQKNLAYLRTDIGGIYRLNAGILMNYILYILLNS